MSEQEKRELEHLAMLAAGRVLRILRGEVPANEEDFENCRTILMRWKEVCR